MLESVQRKLYPYIPSKEQVRVFTTVLVFGTAVAVALNAIKGAAESINEAINSQTNHANSTPEIPSNSQKV